MGKDFGKVRPVCRFGMNAHGFRLHVVSLPTADTRAARKSPIGGTACWALVRKAAACSRVGFKAAINFQKSQFMENSLRVDASPDARRS